MEQSRYGVSLPEIVALIKDLAPRGEATRKLHAHISAALSVKDKSPSIVGMLAVLYRPEPMEERAQKYDSASFVDTSVEMSEFMAALELVSEGKELRLAGASQTLEQRANYEFKGSGNVYTGPLPCILIQLPTVDRQPVIDWSKPLLRFGFPVYKGVEDATAQWIPTIPFRRSHSWLSHVLIAAPLASPHFGAIQRIESRLHVAVEGIRTVDLECKVIATAGENVTVRESLRVDAGQLVIDLASEVDEIDLWLIDSSSAVCDIFTESQYTCSRTARVLHAPPSDAMTEDNIRELIARGESDTLELKAFVRIPDTKAEELVRTAVAFANAAGGTLFIGIDDLGVIDGVEKEAIALYRKETGVHTQADAVAHYCGVLQKFLVERCAPSLDMQVEPVTIATRTVVRVHVRESTAKLVTDSRTGEPYIRRGASSRKLSAAEIERIIERTPSERTRHAVAFYAPPRLGI